MGIFANIRAYSLALPPPLQSRYPKNPIFTQSTRLRFPRSILQHKASKSFVSLAMENPTAGDQAEEWYSVWALPPEDVGARLKRLMADLRSEFGGPEFEPHITVVGAIRLRPDDARRRLRSACAALSPYPARFSSAARGTFFYQCVYLLIDPSPEVMQTSAHCCDHFAYKNSASYMPHLSLLYGDLTDEEKEKARQRVEELDKEISGLSFQVSALALCKTDTEDKTLKSWKKVEVCLCHLGI